MKKASWIILFVVGVAILVVSLISARVAYGGDFLVGPARVAALDGLVPGVGPALQGARATAAAFGAAYGVLWLAVVLGPYRRGEAWAWWGLLAATVVLAAIILLRVPLLGLQAGVATALVPLVLVLLGLLLDLGRLRKAQ